MKARASGAGPPIYPARALVLLAVAGAPVAAVVGALAPSLWLVGPAWVAALSGLLLLDALMAGGPRRAEITVETPAAVSIGSRVSALVRVAFPRGRAPVEVELALAVDPRLGPDPRARVRVEGRVAEAPFELRPDRRGPAPVAEVAARWKGPLGLVWRQVRQPLGRTIAVTSDIAGVKADALRIFSRDGLLGLKAQLTLGDGAEFQALREFQAGMDRRAIDWKQSARHTRLLAKEFRTERNHHVILAVDSGRTMSEPSAGMPRLDRALNAALLLAYVCLRTGDRAGLFAFDSRPRLATDTVSGVAAFPELQRLAATVDYSTEETNHTFGLATLAGRLKRRSMVVVFSEFADPTSAELMIEAVGRLLRRHLVLFVVIRDHELRDMTDAAPAEVDDVVRAVVAATLLRERETVLTRLRRMGAHIVEAPSDRVGPTLLNAYLDIKRRELV